MSACPNCKQVELCIRSMEEVIVIDPPQELDLVWRIANAVLSPIL